MSEQDLHEIENLRYFKLMLRQHRDAPTTEKAIIVEEDLERKYTALHAHLTAAEQRAEQAEAAAAKLAKDALLRLMGDFSEDAYCAGWMMGTENACMDIVSGKIDGWGMVSADGYREQLTELHDLCGGWWVWDDDKGDTVFKLDAEIERAQ